MKINKAIFLDIDGVLATMHEYGRFKEYEQLNRIIYLFDKKCVNVLNKILNETDAKIILSSDWKLHFDIHELKYIFETLNGVIKSPIFTTEDPISGTHDLGFDRAQEIKLVLTDHDIDKYVVIDDLDMLEWFPDNFTYCGRSSEGIKQSGIKEKIVKILNN